MLSRALLAAVALLIVAAGSFLAGKWTTGSAPVEFSPGPAMAEPKGRLKLPPSEAAAAVYAALVHPNPSERASRLARLLGDLDPKDAEDVRATIEPRLGDMSPIEIGLFLQWWTYHDPEGAVAWARSVLSPTALIYTRLVVNSWAHNDFRAARDFVEQFQMAEGLTVLRMSLVRGAYDAGRPELVEYLRGLGRGFEQQYVLFSLAQRIAMREGAEAVGRWAEAISDDDARFKLQVFRRVAKALAQADLVAARAFAVKHRFGAYSNGVLEMVARNEARVFDPQATLAWLGTLSAGPDVSPAAKEAFLSWGGKDVDAARIWVSRAPPESWVDDIRVVYAPHLAGTDGPEYALAWTEKIQDEELRRRAVRLIAVAWWNSDPEAAESWLETVDLPAADMGVIRNQIERSTRKTP